MWKNNVEGLFFKPLPDRKIPFIGKLNVNQLHGYVDSTHISEDRSISRYGGCIFMKGMLISSVSKKLTYVTLSATESEYVGISEGIKLVMYLTDLMYELGETQTAIPMGNYNPGDISIRNQKVVMLVVCDIFRLGYIGFRILLKNP